MNPFKRIATYFRKPKPPAAPATPEYFIVQLFPGQACFELNVKTEACEAIPLKKIDGSKYMLLPKEDCMYEVASNVRNAKRKFVRRLELINEGMSKQ